jgi:pimeloyl-ACP methyl ester carboxylesterase
VYRQELQDKDVKLEEGQCPSIVAHSFGTYILGNALLKYDWLRFDKIILCGSILPQDFPWDELIERGQVQAVRNEYGTEDMPTRVVKWFVAGTGPSGRKGFSRSHSRFEQERFEYTHSEYFDKGHMEAKWLPFLNAVLPSAPVVAKPVARPKAGRPWGLYIIYALVIAVVALVASRCGFFSWITGSSTTVGQSAKVSLNTEIGNNSHIGRHAVGDLQNASSASPTEAKARI